MIYLYLAFHDVACIAATVVLVLTDHPWWTIPFLVAFLFTTVRSHKP